MLATTETITLFNKYINKEYKVEVWTQTIIHGVSWKDSSKTVISQNSSSASKNQLKTVQTAAVRIPQSASTQGKLFVAAQQWGESDKELCWTLQNGDKIIHGEVNEEFTRISELESRYDMITITDWADNRRGGIPHWRVGGM